MLIVGCAPAEPVRIIPDMSKHTSTPGPAAPVAAPPADIFRPLSPLALTSNDLALVERGVRAQLREPYGAKVEGVSAGIDKLPSGQKAGTACGYVRAITSRGSGVVLVPFMGMFLPAKGGGNAAFSVVAFGDDVNRRAAVIDLCRKLDLLRA